MKQLKRIYQYLQQRYGEMWSLTIVCFTIVLNLQTVSMHLTSFSAAVMVSMPAAPFDYSAESLPKKGS